MKVITMYELLRLIKEGKQPNKIKYFGNIYEWEYDNWYYTKEKNYKVCLGGKKEDGNQLFNAFNENVEIIEEDKEIEESIKKLGKKLNGCFKLMVESKKYYYPKIHEDLLEKEDKEIEEAKLKLFEDTGEAVMFPRIQEYNEFNIKELKRVTDELVKAVNELKKGK